MEFEEAVAQVNKRYDEEMSRLDAQHDERVRLIRRNFWLGHCVWAVAIIALMALSFVIGNGVGGWFG